MWAVLAMEVGAWENLGRKGYGGRGTGDGGREAGERKGREVGVLKVWESGKQEEQCLTFRNRKRVNGRKRRKKEREA